MKLILSLTFLMCVLLNDICYSQNTNPFPDIIEKKKKSILPVIGGDSTYKNSYKHLGSGFMVSLDSNQTCIVFVTCDHVITIKDSITNKTIRPVQKLFANVNLINDSIITVPLKLKYRDEINDFAVLEIEIPAEATRVKNNYKFLLSPIPISHLDNANDLKEGEILLYTGYPMSLGVGKRSYPISRSGFVSQNISDSSKFLMDGFSQGGYSGSPVFRIKQTSSNVFTIKVMGMVQAYPIENAIIKSKNQDGLKVIINPGFTIVGKLNPLLSFLNSIKCY